RMAVRCRTVEEHLEILRGEVAVPRQPVCAAWRNVIAVAVDAYRKAHRVPSEKGRVPTEDSMDTATHRQTSRPRQFEIPVSDSHLHVILRCTASLFVRFGRHHGWTLQEHPTVYLLKFSQRGISIVKGAAGQNCRVLDVVEVVR